MILKTNLKAVGATLVSIVVLSACNSGTAVGGSNLKNAMSKIGVGAADSVHFNCSANEADVCNNGGSLGLKTGGSGSKQELKLVVPAAGYGTVKLAIQDQNGQTQDKVKFGSYSTDMTCDFSSSTSCKLTVDATNGVAGQNVKVVALKDDTSVASIGVTVKDGGSAPPPPSDDGFGDLNFAQADQTVKLTDADVNITKTTVLNLTGSLSKLTPFKAVIEFRSNTNNALGFVGENTADEYDCSFDSTHNSCVISYKLTKAGEVLSTPIDIKSISGTTHEYNLPAALPIIKVGQSSDVTPNGKLAVYADHIGSDEKHISYFLRSNSYDHYVSQADLFRQVFDNIKQADPIGFEKYIANNKKVRIIDVIVGSGGSEDIDDFGVGIKNKLGSNLTSADLSKGYYDNNACYKKDCATSARITPISPENTFNFGSSSYSYETQIISYSDLNGITSNDALAEHFEKYAVQGFMFDDASHTSEDRIYIIHCASGADRTGTGAAMFLGYSWKSSNHDNADLYKNALYTAFVNWSDVFTQKAAQTSNKLADPDITVNKGIYTILRDIVGLEDIDANKYPTHANIGQSYSSKYLPEEYAFTSGLCADDTYSGCAMFTGGKLNITTSRSLVGFDQAYLVTRNGDGTTNSVTSLGEITIAGNIASVTYDKNLPRNASIYLARSNPFDATGKPYFVNYLVVTGK